MIGPNEQYRPFPDRKPKDSAMRTASYDRKTKETEISVELNVDGTGIYDVQTGIGFLDHMLEQLSRHSLIDLTVRAKGDTHIDFHHTTEDSGIAIGTALAEALGNRAGITRYGSALIPMDETLTRVALDVSNRPYLPCIGSQDQTTVRPSRSTARISCGRCLSTLSAPNRQISVSRPASFCGLRISIRRNSSSVTGHASRTTHIWNIAGASRTRLA